MTAARVAAAGLAAACAVAAAPARADAGSCGGGGDSGGDGGGDSGGSSGGDSGGSYDAGSSSSAAAPPCIDGSEVLGHRECTGFGTWAMPRWAPRVAVELGSSLRVFSLRGTRFDGRVDHGDAGGYSYLVTGGEMSGEAVASGVDLRMLFGGRAYVGMEASIGAVGGDDRTAAVASSVGATATSEVTLSVVGGGVVGGRVRLRPDAARPVTVAAEVFAGVHTLAMSVDSIYGECVTTSTSADSRLLIEPRVRAEAWLSPWFAVGAFAGADVRGDGAAVMGIYLGGHSRAFDGVP